MHSKRNGLWCCMSTVVLSWSLQCTSCMADWEIIRLGADFSSLTRTLINCIVTSSDKRPNMLNIPSSHFDYSAFLHSDFVTLFFFLLYVTGIPSLRLCHPLLLLAVRSCMHM
eukprot:scpid21415/ scgid25595/ 